MQPQFLFSVRRTHVFGAIGGDAKVADVLAKAVNVRDGGELST